ncbi:vacuolar triacylglycerol lipase [Salix suchowensis]|nr:vacuolar triacylglycerol lipase [Salix suchowensis]
MAPSNEWVSSPPRFRCTCRRSGGAVGYIGNLRRWDHVLKDTLYATQEILELLTTPLPQIYRCFILWNSDWRVIVLPLMLMVGSLVSGYTVCALFVQVDPTQSVFTNRLNSWIQAFYSIAVVQNVITTGLMAFRIWRTSMKSAKYKTENALLPIVRILIESAALQLLVEILLLALYSRSVNAQYILLELVTPTVGITFNAITIRIKLRAINNSAVTSEYSRSEPVQTIGSMPMRRIKVDITTQVEDDTDGKETSTSIHMASRTIVDSLVLVISLAHVPGQMSAFYTIRECDYRQYFLESKFPRPTVVTNRDDIIHLVLLNPDVPHGTSLRRPSSSRYLRLYC